MLYLKNDILYTRKDELSHDISFEDLVKLAENPFTITKNNIVEIIDNCSEPREGDVIVNFIGDSYVIGYTNNSIKTQYNKEATSAHIVKMRKSAFYKFLIDDVPYYLFWAELSTSKLNIQKVMDISFRCVVSGEQLRHRSIVRFNPKAATDPKVSTSPTVSHSSPYLLEEFHQITVDGKILFLHPSGILWSEKQYLKVKLSI